ATCALAEWIGAEILIAPAIKNHISQRGWRRWHWLPGTRAINADYDNFWADSGGKLLPSGDYELSVVPQARTLEDVKAKKRKEWLKRQERLKNLRGDVIKTLGDLAR